MSDTVLFIAEIEKRKAIWDSSSEEYKDRNLRKNLWIEVCLIFHPEFDSLDYVDQCNIYKELQAKWKHIRDSYTRYLRTKKKRSGLGRKPIKTYVFARQLQFLNTLTAFYTECSVQNDIKEKNNQSVDEDNVSHIDDNTFQELENEEIHLKTNPSRKRSLSPIYRRKISRLEEKFDNYIADCQKLNISRAEANGDDDMDFFRSLLPVITQLTISQKMKFRVDVMGIAMQYLDTTDTTLPCSSSPNQNNVFLQEQVNNCRSPHTITVPSSPSTHYIHLDSESTEQTKRSRNVHEIRLVMKT